MILMGLMQRTGVTSFLHWPIEMTTVWALWSYSCRAMLRYWGLMVRYVVPIWYTRVSRGAWGWMICCWPWCAQFLIFPCCHGNLWCGWSQTRLRLIWEKVGIPHINVIPLHAEFFKETWIFIRMTGLDKSRNFRTNFCRNPLAWLEVLLIRAIG